MTNKCPCCNRVIRVNKQETPEDANKRITSKAIAGINAALRKPMPAKTTYRE